MESNELVLHEIASRSMEEAKKVLKQITDNHKRVSGKQTPKSFVKQKEGRDYIEISYMREQANIEYPGWSFGVSDYKFINITSKTGETIPMAISVSGTLEWVEVTDNGAIKRHGGMVAAHRIQRFSDGRVDKSGSPFVDIGSDCKSAVSECMKKAFNVYLNIGDDIYKNEFNELSEEQLEEVIKLAKLADRDDVVRQAEDGIITAKNYELSIKKLNEIINQKKNA